MRAFYGIALLAATALGSAPALANDTDHRVNVGVTAGTLGIGPELGFRLNETFGVRGNVTFFSLSHHVNSDDVRYDADFKLRSGGAMLDVYPFDSGFRISGGFRLNGNKVRGVGRPNDGLNFEIGGTVYTAEDIGELRAESDINDIAPALTLGYSGNLTNNVTLGIEAGALFQGSVEVKPLTITGICATSTVGPCADLRADLEAERLSLNEDIEDYKVYPILQLTLGYRF